MQLGCTVEELNLRLSSSALTRWMAFYELEPWGPSRDNLHMATLAAVYVNSKAKKQDRVTTSDFMLKDSQKILKEEIGQVQSILSTFRGTK